MSTAVATDARRCTPEDLLAMPDGKSDEFVHGRVVQRTVGAGSSEFAGRLLMRLGWCGEEHGLGIVWPAGNGYQCFRHDPSPTSSARLLLPDRGVERMNREP